MLLELFEGFFVNPELVAVVKSTGKKECALFTAGQSAVDEGFTLPYSAKRVAKELFAEEEGGDEEPDEAEEEEEGEGQE